MNLLAVYRSGIALWKERGWKIIYAACIVWFLILISRFYQTTIGFSSLILIGSHLEDVALPKLKATPHYVYEDSWGYDGTYYVQFALSPLLKDPGLELAIDNPRYRARRILVPWVAWLFGGGEPRWIVQAYSLINVGCWLGLAWLLWGWFPPVSFSNFIRWAGLLFSAGVCASVRHAVVDAPGLLLVAGAVKFWEKRRTGGAIGMMAMAILAKETSVVAGGLCAALPFRDWRGWLRALVMGALVVAPLVFWMLYVKQRFKVAVPAVSAFTIPLKGFAEKWGTLLGEIDGKSWMSTQAFTVLVMLGLLVQFLFFITRWKPTDVWWRIGVGFAALTFFLSTPVWEGEPGAAPRVLLPMSLAFNILVSYERRWLPVLILGNLSVFMGISSLRTPPLEFYQLAGDVDLTVERGEGWYGPESKGNRAWRWSQGKGVLRFTNPSSSEVDVRITGTLTSITPRRVAVAFNNVETWSVEIDSGRVPIAPPVMRLAPLSSGQVEFRTDRPPVHPNIADPRNLAFAVHDLVITATPRTAPPSPSR